MALSGLLPDPPQPPDPFQAAAAQTSANVNAGIANSYMNNVNQVTPGGSLNFDVTGSHIWTDPDTGRVNQVPRWTATQSLPGGLQNTNNLTNSAQNNIAGMALGGSQTLQNLFGRFDARGYLAANPDVMAAAQASGMLPEQFAIQHYQQYGQSEGRQGGVIPGKDMSSILANAPGMGDVNWLNAIGFAGGDIGPAGQQQTSLGNAGDITRSYGPQDNFSADRSRVEQAMFERVNPQLQMDEERLRQQLADQGIRYGTPAYEDAMRNFSNRVTDTRLGITEKGGAEQQRLSEMARAQAGFSNEAQQQAYTQMLQGGQFANAAQQQQFSQAQARLNAQNNATLQNLNRQQSIFNAQNTTRNQYMAEQYQARNQPLNEITALMSQSQVAQPQWAQTGNNQIATTDVAGLINQRFNQDLSNVQMQSQNMNNLLGGIFGAVGGIGRGMLSDRTAKENIDQVGTVFAAGPEKTGDLPVYSYSYKDDPSSTRHIGPMAQDVQKFDRSAVRTKGGKKYIDTTKLGSILKVA
jgi:hypothetical protein